jgi:hypothetical protein
MLLRTLDSKTIVPTIVTDCVVSPDVFFASEKSDDGEYGGEYADEHPELFFCNSNRFHLFCSALGAC